MKNQCNMEILKVYIDKKGGCLVWITKPIVEALKLKKGDHFKVEIIDAKKKQIQITCLEVQIRQPAFTYSKRSTRRQSRMPLTRSNRQYRTSGRVRANR